MTYYGYEIHDNLEIDGSYDVFMFGWGSSHKTLEAAKQYIFENKTQQSTDTIVRAKAKTSSFKD